MSNDAADKVRAWVRANGPECWCGSLPGGADCAWHATPLADLTVALAAEYQRGRQEGLEVAARVLEHSNSGGCLCGDCVLRRRLEAQARALATPDD